MRLLGRLLLYLFLALGVARMVLYFAYAAAAIPLPLEAHHLESKMVLLAWRVQQGLSLYPAWSDYPHVANFFGPVDFVAVGLLGRWFGSDMRGLFLIGRVVTFVSGLLTSLILGVWLGRRYGRGAGLAGGVLSLGSGPMFGFSVMLRPDVPAELLGVAGYLLSGGRTRPRQVAGVALLVLAALTKQTSLIFLAAAALALALEGRRRRAFGVLAGGLASLCVLVAAINALIEPNFARSLVGESSMPWSYDSWRALLHRIYELSSETMFLSVVGLWLWLTRRPRDVRPASWTLLIVAGAVVLSGKVGADLNYYLSLRVVDAMAIATLWHAVYAYEGRSTARSAALAATVAMACFLMQPSLLAATVQVGQSWLRAQNFNEPAGRALLLATRSAIAQARNPRVHLLTDSGVIDIYQGERATFGDPWLFCQLVENGRIDPATILKRIDDQYYDMIIMLAEIEGPEYETRGFRLPMVIVERIRARYELKETEPWHYYYRPRGGRRPR
jgi:hypothetical protein